MFRKIVNKTNVKQIVKVNSSKTKNKKLIPIITCKREQFNLYQNNFHPNEVKFGKIPLASDGWYNRKSKDDFFIIHPRIEERKCMNVENLREFSDFKIDSQILNNLHNYFQIKKPSYIQDKSIPEILFGAHTLIAAETGCGKTLAYLIPLLQKVLLKKQQLDQRKFNTPLCLILSPGRELATQIGGVAEKLCTDLNIKVKVILGGKTKQLMLNPNFDDVDILVGTIGAISKLTTTGIYRMNEVRHVVLDEADTLLDDSFSQKLGYFLKRFPFYRNEIQDVGDKIVGTQLILASATMPRNSNDLLQTIIDPTTVTEIVGPELHHLLPNITQRFLKLNKSERSARLVKIIGNDLQEKRPVIVFANKGETCDHISIMLNELNISNVCLNANMLWHFRMGQFEKFQNGEFNVLTATEMGSRGLDTVRAMHIVNYDFPLHIADYIHKIGRIGRVGSKDGCIATNFVSGMREIHVVQRIEHSARTLGVLPNVDGNITGVINERIMKKINIAENMITKKNM